MTDPPVRSEITTLRAHLTALLGVIDREGQPPELGAAVGLTLRRIGGTGWREERCHELAEELRRYPGDPWTREQLEEAIGLLDGYAEYMRGAR